MKITEVAIERMEEKWEACIDYPLFLTASKLISQEKSTSRGLTKNKIVNQILT